jgi:glutathione S-transferase
MILYGSTMSPYVRKVVAFAAEKGIALDIKSVGIGDPDPGFRAASPFAKMPALDDDGYTLADSSAICHYLEAKQPEPALIPAEAKARGKVIWYEEFADTIFFACGAAMFFNRVVAPRFLGRDGDLAAADKAERETLPPLLDYLEGVVPESGYLVGDTLTLADLAVVSPFANLAHCGVTVDAGRYPKLAAYTARILARPSFAASIARETAFLTRTA